MSVPLEHLTLHRMAAQGNYLLLTLRISWDEFPAYAEAVVALVGGRMGERINSGGERVWKFERKGLDYWITWDDLDPGVSIEPCNREAADVIEAIREVLLCARSEASA